MPIVASQDRGNEIRIDYARSKRYHAPMIGRTVSHYKITAKLGAGGMGEVYLAEDTRLDRKVALKFLPTALWNETESQQRLIREAKSASKLDHPNIVTIHGIEELDGRPFIIMAHVRGVTLSEYCASARRTTDELIDLAIQMAGGLHHAHEAGVIHRDLKPSNILVDGQDRVRVLDFGIASLRGATKLTRAGTTMGTLAYAPPELAMGEEATPSSDVYSLGVVMYQMLCGELPFEADHEAALLYSILNEAPRPLSEFDAGIPSDLQAVVMRCLEKAPKNRYATCADLAVELERCRADSASESPSPTGSEKPSVAVLPFANMSADPENEYFSDGLTEELINVLARNPGLKVTGRTSSFAFKGKNEDLREIGQKLGVETLLEGSVRKAGNRVRITAQLVKTADGFHLWSATYDRVLDDIFAVQDDIAQSVEAAMNVTLLGQSAPAPKGNIESYNLVLKANHFTMRGTGVALEKAVALYQQALAIDPDDARAWAGLSRAYGIQAGYGHADCADAQAKGKRAAEKAVALDNTLPDAHDVMGWMYLVHEFQWEKAGQAFRRAHALAPGDGHILVGLALYEAISGRIDEANRLAAKSLMIDPLNPSAHQFLGRVQMAAGLLDESHQSYSKALELSPGMTSVHATKAVIWVLQGRLDEALAEAQKESSAGYKSCSLAIIYHALDDKQKSDEQLTRLLGEGDQWGIQFAVVYAHRGEADLAFEWLDRAYELHDPGIPQVKIQPFFADLHSDPRWPKFLEKIGLAE